MLATVAAANAGTDVCQPVANKRAFVANIQLKLNVVFTLKNVPNLNPGDV